MWKGAGCNLLEKGWNIVIVERQSAYQQHIQNHTTTPYIDLGAGVELPGDDFWSSVVRATAAGLEEVAICHNITQTEIRNLNVLLVVDEQVLGFQVTVYNLMSVAVFHRTNYLLEEFPGFVVTASSLPH
jgi:hypothetical protein